MDAELGVLAASAATTVVNLLATDAWGQVKEKMVGLWRCFRPEQADVVGADLDRARLELRTADETVVLAITREWESLLLRLLAVDAATAAELRRVTAELEAIPVASRAHGDVRQSVKASGRSTVIQIAGDGTVSGFPSPHQRRP
jgi:hypothetical protein